MAFNLSNIISGVQAASSLSQGLAALTSGIASIFSSSSNATTALQNLIQQMIVQSDDPASVTRLAEQIETTASMNGLMMVAFVAAKIPPAATNHAEVLSYASMISAALSPAIQQQSLSQQLQALSPALASSLQGKTG